MEHQGVDPAQADEHQFENEHAVAHQIAGVGDEQQHTGGERAAKGEQCPRQGMLRELPHREAAREAKDARIDHGDGAEQQRDGHQMHRLDQRIGQRMAAQKHCERQLVNGLGEFHYWGGAPGWQLRFSMAALSRFIGAVRRRCCCAALTTRAT